MAHNAVDLVFFLLVFPKSAFSNFESCADGAIRLQGGTLTLGRVEICYNNTWGTVCVDDWDNTDAQVACRQLGFNSASAFALTNGVQDGSGQIWLDDVNCTGNENRLIDCPAQPLGSHDCDLSEDAGVACSGTNIFNSCISYGVSTTIVATSVLIAFIVPILLASVLGVVFVMVAYKVRTAKQSKSITNIKHAENQMNGLYEEMTEGPNQDYEDMTCNPKDETCVEITEDPENQLYEELTESQKNESNVGIAKDPDNESYIEVSGAYAIELNENERSKI